MMDLHRSSFFFSIWFLARIFFWLAGRPLKTTAVEVLRELLGGILWQSSAEQFFGQRLGSSGGGWQSWLALAILLSVEELSSRILRMF